MQFSFSTDVTPRMSLPGNAPLFASVTGSAADLGGGECVFRTADGQAHVMTHQVLQAMDRCRSFLSMAEHIQAVRQVIPSAPAEGIQRVLENLVARRLLVSEADFIARLQAQAAAANDAPMQMLIAATEGSDATARLLQSLAVAADWRQQIADIVLLTTASTAGSRARQQSQLDAFAKNTGCRARMVNAEELQVHVRRLLGADARVLQSIDSLVGTQGRANSAQSFNLGLIAAAGKRSLMLDEHALWPLRRHAEYRRGMELRAVDQVAARFYASSQEALGAGIEVDGGLLRQHALSCGAHLGSLLGGDRPSAWQAGDLRGVALTEFLTDAGDCRIIGTIAGARGSLRAMNVEDFFLLDKESRAALNHDRERYLAQLKRPQLWTGMRRAALTRRSAELPFTLDARDFLPHALPQENAVGATFSSMLRMARPDTALLHLPDAIGYDNPDRAAGEVGKQAITPSFDRFVADFIGTRASDIRAQSGAPRMQTAAALLRDLAESSPADLNTFTAEYLQYTRSELIGRLQHAAEEAGADAPLHWLADLRTIVTVNGRALVQPQQPQLLGDSDTDAAAFTARLAGKLRQAADSMEAWPRLWDRLQDEALGTKGRSA
jgi:hypothetical protein